MEELSSGGRFHVFPSMSFSDEITRRFPEATPIFDPGGRGCPQPMHQHVLS
jgi:hypothetical protein